MHCAFCRLRDAALAQGLSNSAAAKSATLGFMRHLVHEVGRQGVMAHARSLGAMNNFGNDETIRLQTRNETLDSLKSAAIEHAAPDPA